MIFRGSIPHPTQPLCTLRVRRHRRLTQHSLPGGSLGLTWAGLAPADRASFAWRLPSFDNLVGPCGQAGRHLDAECLCGLEVNDELELGRLDDRQVRRFIAPENPSDIDPNLAIRCERIDPIAHEAAGRSKFAKMVDRRHRMARCQSDELVAARIEKWIGGHRERGNALLSNRFKYRVELAIGAGV